LASFAPFESPTASRQEDDGRRSCTSLTFGDYSCGGARRRSYHRRSRGFHRAADSSTRRTSTAATRRRRSVLQLTMLAAAPGAGIGFSESCVVGEDSWGDAKRRSCRHSHGAVDSAQRRSSTAGRRRRSVLHSTILSTAPCPEKRVGNSSQVQGPSRRFSSAEK
jgi:hypothetical protein